MQPKSYWEEQGALKKFKASLNYSYISKILLKNKNDKILDYGSGYGRTLTELNKQGWQNLYGVDFSFTLLKKAKQLVPNAGLTMNNGSNIPFPDNFNSCPSTIPGLKLILILSLFILRFLDVPLYASSKVKVTLVL